MPSCLSRWIGIRSTSWYPPPFLSTLLLPPFLSRFCRLGSQKPWCFQLCRVAPWLRVQRESLSLCPFASGKRWERPPLPLRPSPLYVVLTDNVGNPLLASPEGYHDDECAWRNHPPNVPTETNEGTFSTSASTSPRSLRCCLSSYTPHSLYVLSCCCLLLLLLFTNPAAAAAAAASLPSSCSGSHRTQPPSPSTSDNHHRLLLFATPDHPVEVVQMREDREREPCRVRWIRVKEKDGTYVYVMWSLCLCVRRCMSNREESVRRMRAWEGWREDLAL